MYDAWQMRNRTLLLASGIADHGTAGGKSPRQELFPPCKQPELKQTKGHAVRKKQCVAYACFVHGEERSRGSPCVGLSFSTDTTSAASLGDARSDKTDNSVLGQSQSHTNAG